MKLTIRFVASLALVACATLHVRADTIVYSNDFTGGAGAEWSNPSTVISNGEAFLGANQAGAVALGFGNGTDRLTLNGLPAHTGVTVNFDLYIIESWDGNGPNGGGQDNWQLAENGNNVIFTNFANFTGGNTQSFPNQFPPFGPGGVFAPRTGQFAAGHLGFGTGDFGDATYRFSFTFTDPSSSLSLDFTSLQNQGPGDEGWGLDNVVVSVQGISAVPEPTSMALLGTGALCALGFGWARRKVRTGDAALTPPRVGDA
jgi:hypothetical protein